MTHSVDWTPAVVANYWEQITELAWGKGLSVSRMAGDAILRLVGKTVGLRGVVCDYGAGAGFLVEQLLQVPHIRVSAVEHSPKLAAAVDDKFHNRERYEGCLVIEADHVRVESATFDMVFLIDVLEHLPGAVLERTLEEVRRILKPGGIAVATTPNNEHLDEDMLVCPECGCVYHRWQHVRTFSKETLASLFKDRGVQARLCRPVNLLDYKPRSLKSKVAWKLLKTLTKPGDTNLVFVGVKS